MNISIILCIMLTLVGQGIGWLIASYKQAQYKAKQLKKREKLAAELSAANQEIMLNKHWREEYKLISDQLHNLQDINTSLKLNLRQVIAQLESMKLYTVDKIYQMTDNEKNLLEQFKNLTDRVFEHSNCRINEQNCQSLNSLLAPLREQLDSLRYQIQDSFNQESRERNTLTHEIQNLQKLNAKISQEAVNLARALKGDNKIQGRWGETILTRVLETSGLRKGFEYETQVNIETNLPNLHMKPDVIVHLPQGKDVIIDAKMTLTAYERYFNSEDEYARELALQDHISSVRSHIRRLGNKNYQRLPGLCTLDYVLMFIPIEPAFLLALNRQPELINEALRRNIMLVSPTTLLVALRTIANFWRYDRQNRNAQKISERASKLYDKIRLFVDDLSLVGQSLDLAQENYCQAIKKLTYGRGNLLAQAEIFRSLGVEIKREIDPKLMKRAMDQDKEHQLHDESKNTDDTSVNSVMLTM